MKARQFSLSFGLAAFSAACTGPQLTAPKPLPQAPSQWSNVDAQVTQDAAALDWWKELRDPQLNELVEKAMARNADLRAATANWKASRALVREAQAARLPMGSVDLSLQRTRTAGASLQLDTIGGPSVLPSQTLSDVGASFSWEIDLFGRLGATVRASKADAVQALWQRRGTEAAIAAEVVRAWCDLAQIEQQLAIIDKRQPLLAEIVKRLEGSLSVGGIRRDKVEEARLALAEVDEQRPQLEVGRRNAIRRLATLTGVPAPAGVREMISILPGALPVPAYVRAGRPEDLLRMRPDVAAAEQDLMRALARVQIAKADLYPRLTLVGSIGSTAAPSDAMDTGALRFGVGPMLNWGIFDMERTRARIRAAGEQAVAAGALWESAFMRALEETDAALDTFAAARKAATIASSAVENAEKLAELGKLRYETGQESMIAAMLSSDQALRAQLQNVRASGFVRSAWVDVQIALGAGWRKEEDSSKFASN